MFFIPICAASDSGGMEFVMKEHDSSIAIELLEMKNSSVSAWKASAGLYSI